MAGYPGSGATWFSSIFLNLGLCFICGYQELMVDDHSQKTKIYATEWRRRIKTYSEKDKKENYSYSENIRIIKTHSSSIKLNEYNNNIHQNNKILLLVRDYRDSVISYYNWLLSVHSSSVSSLVNLETYISTNSNDVLLDMSGEPPPKLWSNYYRDWLNTTPAKNLFLLSFEECRAKPVETIQRVLEFMGVERDDASINNAIKESSYKEMKKYEDSILKNYPDTPVGNAMHRGKVGGWKDILTENMLLHFQGIPKNIMDQLNELIKRQSESK